MQQELLSEQDYAQMFEDVLGSDVRWGPTGEGSVHCPYPDHDDQNPSFSVNRFKGVFYCHGCNRKGHIKELANELGKESYVSAPKPKARPKPGKQPRKKKIEHEREHVYKDHKGQPHLLVGIDGTGKEKRVVQYHWENGDWYVGGSQKAYPFELDSLKWGVKNKRTIFVVEGEKDVWALKSRGKVATTNPGGAGKWPTDQAFNSQFKNANVVILPDNDEVGKNHALKVAAVLVDYAEQVKILELPDLEEKEDVTDWLFKKHTFMELKELVEQTPIVSKEDVGHVLEKEQEKEPNEPKFFDENNKFQPVWLAKHLLESLPMFNLNGILHVYDNGVYRVTGENLVRQKIQRLLGDRSRKVYIQEVLNWLKTETYLNDSTELNQEDDLINVKNGLLNWKTGELSPHTPKRLSTIQIPVYYDPKADPTFVNDFFKNVIPEDAVPTMEEIFGYCMIPTSKYQKAFMFTGEGANGKSTVIDLLTDFVGIDNTTSISLQDLEKNRFKLAQSRGKLLNTFSDLSHKAIETSGNFKSIVAGDRMSAEFKGKDAFDFEPFARLVFSANEPPRSRDVSYAYFRRWIIIPFPYTFGSSLSNAKKADPTLGRKLQQPENLSALLNVALTGLRRLTKQGDFTMNKSTQQALEEYKQDLDNVKAFLTETCIFKPDATVPRPSFFEAYKKWCVDSGFRALGKSNFNKRLLSHCPSLTITRKFQGPEMWVGIGLVTNQYGDRV